MSSRSAFYLAAGSIATDVLLRLFFHGLHPIIDFLLLGIAFLVVARVLALDTLADAIRVLKGTEELFAQLVLQTLLVVARSRDLRRRLQSEVEILEQPCPCGSEKKFKHCHGQLRSEL